jgi:hypothetical protein
METYHGHVCTPGDAIILFEACRIGLLHRVQKRLSEKERQSIQSGSVFVWDESESGIRRWTDGKSWGPSRVSGSFLVYCETEGKRRGAVTQPLRAGKTPDSRGSANDPGDGTNGPYGYRYKPGGLMKQSFSITTATGQHLHLVSYYSRSRPAAATLQQPSTDPVLRNVYLQKGLYPESTVNDQQNLAVVNRGPVADAAYPRPMSAYVRAGIAYRQSCTPPYACSLTPLVTMTTMTRPYGASYPSAVPKRNGPDIVYAKPHPHPHPHPALPQPPPQHGLPPPCNRLVNSAYPVRGSLPSAIQFHRKHSPSASHSNGGSPAVRSSRMIDQTPPTLLRHLAPPLLSEASETADSNSNGIASTSATTILSIGALMNGAPGHVL